MPYFNDFEGAIGPEWTAPRVEGAEPLRFTKFLGRSGPQTLTLSGLTPGTSYTVAFDLYIIDTWDGGNTNSGDIIMVQVDGVTLFRESFANYGGTQTYPRNPDEGRESLGFNIGNNWVDALYRGVTVTFTPTGSVATIVFNGVNLEVESNESWGVDNVGVQLTADSTNTVIRSTTLPAQSSTNSVAISFFGVFANQPLQPAAATNAANWSLRESGGNGIFGDGDDTVVTLTVGLAPTFLTGRSLLFNLPNGPLPPGRYQFQSSASLVDTNGTTVPVFTRNFAISQPILGAIENSANDTIPGATPLPLAESPAGSGFFTAFGVGNFSSVGEVDYWRFDAEAGDRVNLRIEGGEGSYPRLYLQNISGGNLATVGGNYQGVATIQQYTFSSPGTYYLRVWTDNRATPYQLRVDLGRTSQLETEGNDSSGSANAITFSASPGLAQGRIAGALPTDDPTGDYYLLTTLNPGNSVGVTARFPDGSALNSGTINLEVLVAGNATPLATNTGNTVNYTVVSNAVYYVRAWSTNLALRSQYVLDFAIGDGVAPAITGTSFPAEGASTGAILDRFSLNFSENLILNSVTNRANYELRGAGADATFGTADDAIYTVNSDPYDGGLVNSYLIPDGPLQPGLVRLTVRSNLIDRVGNPMAAPYVRTFAVTNVPGFVLEPRDNQIPGRGGYFVAAPGAGSDGTFALYSTLATGNQPHYLVGADLNSDGILDLIVPNYNSQTVTLATNDGKGNFQVQTNLTGFSGPVSIAVGRFNNDTNNDFAVANYSGNTIAIMLATNDGFALLTNISGFNTPYQIATADLNNDGFLDLAVPNYNGSSVRVLLGRGDGTFSPGTNFATPANPMQVVIGKLNGDNIPDLAVANYSGTISVLFGNGDGSFQAATNLPSGQYTRSVAIADVTGDGTNDLVSISIGEDTLNVFRGNGNGTFQPRVAYPSGTSDAYQLAVGDLNGDGFLDVVVPAYDYYGPVAVLLNNGSGMFTNLFTLGLDGNSYAIGSVIADFNGDGRNDLAVSRHNSGGISVLIGNPVSSLPEDPPGSGLRSGFVRGNITDNSDGDYYRFTGNAGDLAVVAIETPGAPGNSGLRVDLLQADGTGLTGYYPNNTGWGQSAVVVLPYTGTYLVLIQRWYDYRDEYRVRVSTARPPLRFETEDNNSLGNANLPAFAQTNGHLRASLAGYISRGDAAGDYYNLGTLAGGTTLNLTVTQPGSSGFAAILTIYNAAGQFLTNSVAGVTNFTVMVPAGADGVYYARLTADPVAPAQNIGGQPGYALLLSGAGDYVSILDSPSVRPVNFTVEGWFNFASLNNGQHLLAKTYGGGDDDSYVVWYDGGYLRSYITSGPQLLYPWTPEIGRWYHIAFVFDDAANTQTLYVDGQPVASGAVNSSPAYDSHPLLLGAEIRYESPTAFFAGKIDEVRLWNVARASNEIAAALSQRLTGNEAGLAGYWRLDEGTGGTTADATANGNTGTLINNPVWTSSALSATRPMALAAQYVLNVDLAETSPLVVSGNSLPAPGSTASNVLQSFMLSFNKELDPRVNNLNRAVFSYGTNKYLLTGTASSWLAAEAFAVSVGGHLATISDAAENTWLWQTFSPFGDLWIGLNDRAAEGAFQWISGQPFTYTNWLANLPNNAGGAYGVYLDNAAGQWGDSASTALRGIVELPALPDADGDGIPDSLDTFPADLRNAIELRSAGLDGVFDTSDDVLYDLDTTGYTQGTNLTLNVVDGPLQAGLYRLTVTPSLRDRLGNPLSATYTRTFTVVPVAGYVLENRNNGAGALATSLSATPNGLMSGTFALSTNYPTGNGPHYLLVTNLNSDTNLDLIVANYNNASLSVFLGQPDGTFQLLTNHTTPNGPIGMVVADFNKDGKPDVAVVHYTAGSVGIRLGDGTGVFNALTNYATPANPYYLVTADFNKDGNLDLATVNITGDNISVLLGNGDGTFQPRSDIATGDGAFKIATADLNGDTNPDILVVNRYVRTLTVLLGNGNGTFQTLTNYPMSDTGGALGIADLDGDAVPDAVVICYNTLYFFHGNGDGTFAPATTFNIGTQDTYDMALVDIDGNGTLDVVVADYGNSTLVTVANLGGGNFGNALAYGMGGRILSVGTGDFNRDGRLDLALANYSGNNGNTVQVMLGVGSQPLAFDSTTGFRNSAGRGILFNNADEDYWTFTAQANDRMVLAVEIPGSPANSRDRFLIYEPDGSQLADLYPDYYTGLLTYNTILGAAGTYTIRVLNYDQYRGEYRFRVTLAPSPLQYETEDNNTIANADALVFALDGGKQTADAFGYIGLGDPADFYRLGNLSEGTAITLRPSRPNTSSMVPWVSLYNAAGVLVTNGTPGGTNLSYVIGPGGSGAYFARVQTSYPARNAGVTNGLLFDGSNDYINTGNWSPGSRWSVQAWVQPLSTPSGRRTIAGGFGSCTDWGITLQDGRFGLVTRQPGGCTITYTSPTVPVLGAWYHLAGTCDGTNAYFYVNGVLAASGPVDLNYGPYGGGTWIGGEVCCGGNNFPGLIQEVSIWNRALTQSDITGIMATNLTGSETNLQGYWRLLEDAGTTAADLSPQNRTGTLVNGPLWVPLANTNATGPGILAEYRLDIELVDTQPPYVTGASLPAEGSATSAIIDRFSVGFSEDMNPTSVWNSANYELRNAGADSVFGTADDGLYAVQNSPAYASGTNASYFITDGPLQAGNYRFTVRTNVTDTSGSRLAAVYVQTFAITNVPGYILENRNNGDAGLATSLSVARTNRPSGGLKSPGLNSLPAGPEYVVAGYLDGDTNLDLVIPIYENSTISVFTGRGDGTFQLRTNFAGGSGSLAPVLALLNDDTNLDLVVGDYTADTMTVYLGNGDGTFTRFTNYNLGDRPYGMVTGDFNGDGRADMAVVNNGSNTLSVLFGNGDGRFQPAVNYATGGGPIQLGIGDVNGDGRPDLVCANSLTDNLSLFLNNGNGTFAAAVQLAVNDTPRGVALADLNGDGRLDLVSGNNDNTVSVLFGNGNGTFQPRVNLDTGTTAIYSVKAVDFNGDGRLDLVTAGYGNNRLAVLLNAGGGRFEAPTIYTAGNGPLGLEAADFNGDGRNDLVVANYQGKNFQVFLGADSEPLAPDGAGGLVFSGLGRGNLFNNSDYDYWSFTGNAGDSVQVALEVVGSPAASGLLVYIYRPDGSQLSYFYTDYYGRGTMTVSLPVSGTYTVMVRYYYTYSGEYRLRTSVVKPPLQVESENNDGTGSADVPNFATVFGQRTARVFGSFSSDDSYDFYRLGNLSAGTTIRLSYELPALSTLSASLALYAGNSIVSNGPANVTNLVYTIPTGDENVYYVRITSANGTAGLLAHYILNLELGDNTTPQILSSSLPANGTTTLGLWDRFTLSFNKDLDPSAGSQNFRLRNGRAYFLTSASVSWPAAEAEAITRGGHLVTVRNAADNDWLMANFGGTYWIGFSDEALEGTYAWANGEPVTFTNWNPGEPNNSGNEDYAEFQSSGKWNDVSLSASHYGIIEVAGTDSDGDGIPDAADPFPTDPYNLYDLRATGPDGEFDTPDDEVYKLVASAYSSGLSLGLSVVNGPLQSGQYRFRVTTSLRDTFGNSATTPYDQFFTVGNLPGFTLASRTNNTSATATPLELQESPTAVKTGLARGKRFDSSDADYWSFTASTGDTLLFASETPGSPGASQLHYEVFDPAGTRILDFYPDYYGAGQAAPVSLNTNGAFVVRVSNYYTYLEEYRFRATIVSPPVAVEAEANDTLATATLLPLATNGNSRAGSMLGSANGAADLDYFNLGQVTNGSTVFLSVRLPNGSTYTPAVSVYNASGQYQGEANGGSSGDGVAEVRLTATGNYYALVRGTTPAAGLQAQYVLDAQVVPTGDVSFPNLIVTTATLPGGAPQSGQQVNYSFTVGNTGSLATVSANWLDRAVFSTNTTLGDGDDIPLGFIPHFGALAPGQVYTVTNGFTLPEGISGDYYLIVLTDAGNAVNEFVFEADNTYVSSATFHVNRAPYADLKVESLGLAGPDGNGTYSVTWTSANRGNAPASNGFYERFFVRNLTTGLVLTNVETLTSAALAAGDTLNRLMLVTTTNAGSYQIEITTDSRNGYYEFDAVSHASAELNSAITNFLIAQIFNITVAANPPGAGAVSGGGNYVSGSIVAVNTQPITNTLPYYFVNWTENGVFQSATTNYSFTATRSRALVANFSLPAYLLLASNNPPAGGTVAGQGSFFYGSTNVLTAAPNPGYRFTNWTENGAVIAESLSLTNIALSNRLVVANYYEANPFHVVTTATSPTNIATVSGAGSYTNGQSVVISAPPSVTNPPSIYNFREFRLTGALVGTSPSFTKLFSTLDSTNLQYIAIYDTVSILPLVSNVTANYPNPVPATTNFQMSFQFNRSMNTNASPLVVLSNRQTTVQITRASGGAWSATRTSNDTYTIPPVTFAAGADGTNDVFVSLAQDLNGGTLALTNAGTVIVDVTPPPLPVLTLTSSNSSSVTVSWTGYAAPADVAAFRAFLRSSNYASVVGLPIVAGLSSATRSYTFGGLALDTTYYLVIVPVDVAGNIADTVSPMPVFLPSTVPPPVTVSVTALDVSTANISWSGYSTANLFGFANFKLYYETNNFSSVAGLTAKQTLSAGTRSAQATGLDRHLTYYFAVVGLNGTNGYDPAVTTASWSDPYAGNVTANLTIGGAGQTVDILQPMSILNNAIVTIPAGTTLRFAAGAGLTVQQGRLNANGTALDPIVFTSLNDTTGGTPAAGDWNGITLGTQAGASVLRHIFVKYGAGLTLDGCAPTVEAFTAVYNSPAGLSLLNGATLTSAEALLAYNGIGARQAGASVLNLRGSVIKNNGTNALNTGGTSLIATQNWWGSASATDIDATLSGSVNRNNFLAGEPLLTPAIGTSNNVTQVGTSNAFLRLACRTADAMRISEDSAFFAVFYEPFAPAKAFLLSEGGGLKTIYAQFRSVTGQTSAPVAITITFITDGPVINSFSLTEGAALGRPVNVTGAATAPLGMAAMEFYVDNQGVATNAGGALSARFDQRGYSNGIHRVKLLARDNAGRIATLERNVSISPTPPPAPVISQPATDLLVTSNTLNVAGTAEPLIDVRLLRNGAVVGVTTASGAGAWAFSNVSLSEGDNQFVASAFDTLGSGNSPTRLVVLDSGPPTAPVLDTPIYRPGTGLEFAWRYAATGERPSRFRLYWHTAPFTSVAQATGQSPVLSGPLTYLVTGLPAGAYYFGIVGYDDAGNGSALSTLVSYTYDPVPPAFNIAFNKPSPVGVGPLRVSLTANEALSASPSVTLDYGTGPIAFTLTNAALNTYEGTLNVGVFTPSAPVNFKVSAQDLANNVFNGAPAGPALVIDVAPPRGSITTVPAPPVQATNPTTVSVSLVLNEPVKPGTIPELAFTPPAGGAAVPITLSGSAQSWVGLLTLQPSMGSGFGQFTMTAVDNLDNVGHGIINGASLEIYNTASPSAPPTPVGLRAVALAGGNIRLDWLTVSNAEIYRLYTDAGTSGVPVTVAADNITLPFTTNLPPDDGPWRFAVSALRRGSESSKSTAITATSDRTPPSAPTNVTVQLVATGLRIGWQPGDGPAPNRYNVYRNGVLIRSVSAGGTNVIDIPPRGIMAYTVGALDSLGNEAVSQAAIYELFVGAVNNLEVVYNLDQAPILTWQPGDVITVGYNVYRNGVKQNVAPLTSPTYTDNLGVQPGTVVNYAVKAVNSTNAESAARTADVYDVNFLIMANLFGGAESPLVTTYFDAYQVTVFNRSTASDLPLSSIELRRAIPGQPQLTLGNEVHALVAPGANVNREIVFPGSPSLAAQSILIRAIQEVDDGGTRIYYQNPVDYVTVADPGVMMEVSASQPPLAGGLATLTLRVFNRGFADVDLVVARGSGLQPGDLSVVVRNQMGQEVSRAEYAGMPPGSFLTPAGVGYLRIVPGGSKTFTVGNILVPDSLGTNATTFEAKFSNIYYRFNTSTQLMSGPISGSMVSSLSLTPYFGTLVTDKAAYADDEVVQMSGQAINRSTGLPQPNAPLRIGFFTRGFKYYQSVTSDFSGNFTYTYTPPAGVSGTYKLWAAHPDVYDILNQAEVKIYRVYLSPSAGDIRMTKSDTLSFNITLVNPGDEDLSGFTLQTDAWTMSGTNRVPITNLTATVDLAPDFVIGSRENIRIRFNLTATIDAPDNAQIQFRLRSAEGATAKFDGNITLLAANPLLTVTDPTAGYVDVSLNKGALLSRSVTIVNRGLRDLLGVTLQPPTNIAWMLLNMPVSEDGLIHLPDFKVGGTNTLTVVFTPPSDTPTAYYQDKLVLRGTNTPSQFPVNLYALITSASKGNVRFVVDNILVQPVPDATIRIKNTILQEEYTVKTDANGEALIENLQEGPWAWQILAAGHASDAGRVDVVANQTVLLEPRLSRSLVTVTFTVTPVPFTDRYEITIEQTFQTHVPAPVLVMTPPSYDFFNVEAGFEATVIHNVKNHGLVKAFDLQIRGGADGYATTTPLINYVPELGAEQSIDIPFRFYFRGRDSTNTGQGLALNTRSKCEGSRAKCLGRDIDENGNITGGVNFPPGYGQPTPGDCTGGIFDVDNFAGALMAIADACAQCQDLKTLMYLATKGVQKYTEKAKFWNAIEGVILVYRLLGCPTAPGGGGNYSGGGGDSGSGGGGTRGYTDYGTGGGCFAAGTQVLLADGRLVPIEQIHTNEVVRTGPDNRERATVVEIETRSADALMEISLADGRKIAATPEHQIWVDAKGWTFAHQLKVGDWLFTSAGTRVRVSAIARVEKKVKVYTFTNREDHAFYANGVLVRDSCGDKTPFFRLPSLPETPVSTPAQAGVSGKEAVQ